MPDMGVMLYPQVRLPFDSPYLRYPLLGSEKLDGHRMLVFRGAIHTRTGQAMANRNIPAHFAELVNVSRSCDLVFDCECYDPTRTLHALQSILQSASAPVPDSVGAYVFDCLTFGEWMTERAARYERRVDRCRDILNFYKPVHTFAVDQKPITTAAEAAAMYDAVRTKGGEGIVLRSTKGRYKQGRCNLSDRIIFKFREQAD